MLVLPAVARPFVLLLIACLLVGLPRPLRAQEVPPKRELRGVWIATVENIDWPSSRNLSPEQQRREYRRILDDHQRTGTRPTIRTGSIRSGSCGFRASCSTTPVCPKCAPTSTA